MLRIACRRVGRLPLIGAPTAARSARLPPACSTRPPARWSASTSATCPACCARPPGHCILVRGSCSPSTTRTWPPRAQGSQLRPGRRRVPPRGRSLAYRRLPRPLVGRRLHRSRDLRVPRGRVPRQAGTRNGPTRRHQHSPRPTRPARRLNRADSPTRSRRPASRSSGPAPTAPGPTLFTCQLQPLVEPQPSQT